jgi:phage terminase large subunit-like protein
MNSLTTAEKASLLYNWPFWARPQQLAPPGTWTTWLILAGRGFGKTRSGAEYIRQQVAEHGYGRVALVAETAADARDVMVEGESGILAISPPWFRPKYEPSKRRLTWPNGAIATTYSADDPDQLRGPQHDLAWCDEIAKWRYIDAWDQLQFGLRLGNDPRCVATTTPRPIPLIRDLIKDPTTVTTSGSTFDNRANLPDAFFQRVVAKYEGSRLGQQELHAVILDDIEGALWKRQQLEDVRVRQYPELTRIVVGVDPAPTSSDESAETGIVVAGLGVDGQGYVLADVSLRDTPSNWAKAAVNAYHTYKADRIVAEANNGGDLIEHTIRTIDRKVAYKKVHASRGKQTRAEPISALYEQGKVHHVGYHALLEDQMTTWLPGLPSPDRMDALVWALTELMISAPPQMSTGSVNFYAR